MLWDTVANSAAARHDAAAHDGVVQVVQRLAAARGDDGVGQVVCTPLGQAPRARVDARRPLGRLGNSIPSITNI